VSVALTTYFVLTFGTALVLLGVLFCVHLATGLRLSGTAMVVVVVALPAFFLGPMARDVLILRRLVTGRAALVAQSPRGEVLVGVLMSMIWAAGAAALVRRR